VIRTRLVAGGLLYVRQDGRTPRPPRPESAERLADYVGTVIRYPQGWTWTGGPRGTYARTRRLAVAHLLAAARCQVCHRQDHRPAADAQAGHHFAYTLRAARAERARLSRLGLAERQDARLAAEADAERRAGVTRHLAADPDDPAALADADRRAALAEVAEARAAGYFPGMDSPHLRDGAR
jgi:hypothetical protein